jgi:precorrin-2 dehydrogenase/sirohydrochlorin ferrochelatase
MNMAFSTFMVGLRLMGRPCLVVGSGNEACARARALLDAEAAVRVVAEQPTSELRALAETGAVTLIDRAFEESDLEGVWLAVLAERDAPLAARMHAAAETLGVFFCAVDEPAYSSYSHLGIARAGAVSVAVGTGGKAPALTRRLREELERVLCASDIAAFAERLANLRERTPSAERAELLGRLVEAVHLEGKLIVPPEDD